MYVNRSLVTVRVPVTVGKCQIWNDKEVSATESCWRRLICVPNERSAKVAGFLNV